jgi:hypothetical protein
MVPCSGDLEVPPIIPILLYRLLDLHLGKIMNGANGLVESLVGKQRPVACDDIILLVQRFPEFVHGD